MSNFEDISRFLTEKNVCLVAVSKTQPVEAIQALYGKLQRDFGENRVQELRDKQAALPKDIHWHLIGHLQTNKVKYIAEWIYMIHSIDSLELLQEINKQAAKYNRVIPCLLQTYIATEDTKFGMDQQEIINLLESASFKGMNNVAIYGLMGMATNTIDVHQIRTEFNYLKSLYDKLKATYFATSTIFTEISMGMSGDYQIAVESGSTMVRIGSLLFGERTNQ